MASERWRGPGAAVVATGLAVETNASGAGRGKGFTVGRGRGMKGKAVVG